MVEFRTNQTIKISVESIDVDGQLCYVIDTVASAPLTLAVCVPPPHWSFGGELDDSLMLRIDCVE